MSNADREEGARNRGFGPSDDRHRSVFNDPEDLRTLRSKDLRQRAEDLVKMDAESVARLAPEAIRELVHELQVHQVELELQNEQLLETQLELERVRDRYAELYDFAPVGYLSLDRGHRIRQANMKASVLLGVERSKLVGSTIMAAAARREDADHLHRHLALVAELSEERSCTLKLLRGETPFHARLVSAAVPATNDEGICYRLAVSDITPLVEIEEKRRRLDEKIQQAQKLDSLTVLAGGIAHDFNNLLASILGFASLARKQTGTDSSCWKSLLEIENAALKAADLSRQLLAYAGKGTLAMKEQDLSQVVREMTSLLEICVSKGASLILECAEDIPPIWADHAQIDQIMMNMITNAAEAIGDEGGVIRIRTGMLDVDRSFLERARFGCDEPPGRYAYVEVCDTGCGMDRSTQERLFDPFFTTKNAGHGLGMAAVQGIVRRHHAALRLESAIGHGTTITVCFPVLNPGRAAPTHRQPAKTSDHSHLDSGKPNSLTVLVIDDERAILELIQSILRHEGHKAILAKDGLEGISLFEQYQEEIDAVVLDMVMPKMGGAEVFMRIRRLKSDVPVIVSSGNTQLDRNEQFGGCERVEFLPKPYHAGILLGKLRSLVGS